MSWIETCKIDANNQIDFKKQNGDTVKKAIRVLSKESGIPQGTLKRWYYNIENKKRITNDPLDNALYETCGISDLNVLTTTDKKFGTIYADPPWQYSNQATRASTDNHYSTMAIDEIINLPIADLTAEKAHLHLWTTNAFLFECPAILKAWGFEYKSMFVWVKPQMGLGNYWRLAHEYLVLGVKGKERFGFKNENFKSWLEFERLKHSAKPEIIAQMIEKVSPGPYLELFGRKTRENWTVWGNEIDRTLFNKEAFK